MPFPEVMQAPEGTTSASILGHSYDIPANGKIKVAVQEHVETLRRHGFTDTIDDDVDLDAKIDDMDDKDELEEFIEEHGGDVPSGKKLKLKELRALAKKTVNDQRKGK